MHILRGVANVCSESRIPRKKNFGNIVVALLGPDVDLSTVGEDPRCEGFSGADMTALVREASMAALRQLHPSLRI
jgi:SpoVK/Ycf46/Vps4 family AAA+-type ATPase